MNSVFGALLLLFSPPAFAGGLNGDKLLSAMDKELRRSVERLRHAEKAPLYFLSYEITDSDLWTAAAEVGGIIDDRRNRLRYLDVQARVGSPELDNFHQVKGQSLLRDIDIDADRAVPAPADDDEGALRAALWRQTDSEFKQALEKFTKVRTNRAVTAEETDKSPDFSAGEPAAVFYEETAFPKTDRSAWLERLKKYSLEFRGESFIFSSRVNMSVAAENMYFTSSEGSRIRTGRVYATLSYQLSTRTADGMDLERANSYHGRTPDELPGDDAILADIARSIAELRALKDAPLAEPYSGPAILRNRASGVFFHEIFGHRVEGARQKDESGGQTFAGKVGERILSPVISVADDPTLERFNGTALRGYYKFDDEGVRAQRAPLVEKGVLKGFLMSRSPVKGFPRSNGHGRSSPGFAPMSRMANTIVTAENTVPYVRLREMLLAEIRRQGKPYGLIFDDIAGGFTNTGRYEPQAFKVLPLLVHRVYPDGRPDEVVRGVDIIGTPLTSFAGITAAGDDPAIFNGTCGAESGWVPVSAVSPSILVSEIEVQKVFKEQERPPVLPPPAAGPQEGKQ